MWEPQGTEPMVTICIMMFFTVGALLLGLRGQRAGDALRGFELVQAFSGGLALFGHLSPFPGLASTAAGMFLGTIVVCLPYALLLTYGWKPAADRYYVLEY